MVFVVFVFTLLLLVFIMLLLGASQYLPTEACALIFPVIRYLGKRTSELLLFYVDPEAIIVAENLSMTSFAIGLTLLVGNKGDFKVAVGVAVMDIVCGCVTAYQMVDNSLHRCFLRLRNCGKEVTDEQMHRSISQGKATFVASEVGEVIVPITYCIVFLIVYNGPSPEAFTGIGTSDFGVQPPQSMEKFATTMGVLILADAVGTLMLRYIVYYITGLNVIEEMRQFYRSYGLILTVQSIWIIHTAFCATMILCGLDYSFKLKMISHDH
mmetsp:Transcript_64975/g.115498  ORF Transcript_64975/g.115498 Transcript_64975/m.115498 type:complete len:268 (-) Transcript_64975:126-929(-)